MSPHSCLSIICQIKFFPTIFNQCKICLPACKSSRIFCSIFYLNKNWRIMIKCLKGFPTQEMFWEMGPEVFGEVRIELPSFDFSLGCFIWTFHFLFGFWAFNLAFSFRHGWLILALGFGSFNWAINFYLGPWLKSNLQISNNLWSTKELIKNR
jgi:hypothetical protein